MLHVCYSQRQKRWQVETLKVCTCCTYTANNGFSVLCAIELENEDRVDEDGEWEDGEGGDKGVEGVGEGDGEDEEGGEGGEEDDGGEENTNLSPEEYSKRMTWEQ